MTQLPEISFAPLTPEPQAAALIYFVAEGEGLPAHIQKLDEAAGSAITKAMQVSAFKRKRKSVIEILAPHGIAAGRLLLVGLGDPKTLNARDWEEIGGAVRSKLQGKAIEAGAIFAGAGPLEEEGPLGFALGFSLRSYAFKKYKSKAAPKGENEEGDNANGETIPRLTIFSGWGEGLERAHGKTLAVSNGVYLARDLVNEPANILTPPEFTGRLRALEAEGLRIEVLDERALRSLGMNALLSVGQGSAQPSSAVILRWDGVPSGGGSEGNLVFIGKGVCFDTGGISIKPA
ncbi:MAG: leucyl aminopeptidase, partial [Rhodomicrobium sp.]|nr:leucyl aminopeptidase [Rhodomicrobium sp.]